MRTKQNATVKTVDPDDYVIITKKKLECIRAAYYVMGAAVGIISATVFAATLASHAQNTPEDN